ncbi:MAG: cell wall metabolism sensor histidine kinase WalK, partial [Firmicutes bacterium]|nr:cell wall metabolism sensor histidine kinase WalK [Bacillota bacterium]
MFRSIFQKLLFTYAAIIIFVVVLLAALMTYFFKCYLLEQKQNQLLAAGRAVGEMARENGAKINKREDLVQAVNTLGAVTDSRIYVLIDRKLAGIRTLDDPFTGGGDEGRLLDDIKRIMDGETIVREKEFSNQLNMYVVFVGMPITVNNAVSGVVLLFSPLDQLNKTLFRVYRIIWGTAAASLALAAVIIYILSRRISTPIEKIQKAAAGIAEGTYT